MTREAAEFLLKDLARWTFGSLLASRASFTALEADELSAEVRAYRYGILLAATKEELLLQRELAEPWVAAPWEWMQDWAAFGRGLAWNSAAEESFAGRFIERMQKHGQPTEALRRFARGKAFKYGRRALMLSGKLDGN